MAPRSSARSQFPPHLIAKWLAKEAEQHSAFRKVLRQIHRKEGRDPEPPAWVLELQRKPEDEEAPLRYTWLFRRFPSVKPALLMQIVRHELKPMDLAKLGMWWDNREAECVGQDYGALPALLQPLLVYFRVLVAAVAWEGGDAAGAAESAMRYMTNLVELSGEHLWPGVVLYHMAFHEKQLDEMRRDEYGSWASEDGDMREKHLVERGWVGRVKTRLPSGKF